MVKKLKYGNTNTFFVGNESGILLDTDLAGTLQGFFREIKRNGIPVEKQMLVKTNTRK